MERDECVLLAPIPGMYGPVSMWGSVHPAFRFQAYDKDRKEFMDVHVEVSLPSRMEFYSYTADEGDRADTHPDHKTLALTLFNHLVSYFPLTQSHKIKKVTNELNEREDSQAVQGQNGEVKVPETA